MARSLVRVGQAAFRRLSLLLALLLVLSVTSAAQAHPLGFGTATLVVRGKQLSVELVLDTPPEFTEGTATPSELKVRRARLAREVGEGFSVFADGVVVKTQLRVVMLGQGPTAVDVVQVNGEVSSDVKSVSVSTSEEIGDISLVVHRKLPAEPFRQLVVKGRSSTVVELQAPPGEAAAQTPASSAAKEQPGTSSRGANSERSARDSTAPGESTRTPSRPVTGFLDYVWLGFEHILPLGVDHILFVLGVFLLASGYKKLILQLSLFTVAHSVTLALGVLDLVRLSPLLVEPLIALSIAYIGLERHYAVLERWRSAVIFGFGLLHGLGFAGVLLDLGLGSGSFLSALLGFNLGVELGQLAVVLIAFVLTVRFSRSDWYAQRLVPALTWGLAAVGLFWFVERIFA